MEEIWKDIKGYEGVYQISNLGRVKSVKRMSIDNRVLKEKIMKNQDKRGYYQILLNKKCYRINRLVAEAFIPNPDKLPEVNHINGIKTDNRVENLEWILHEDNMKHATETIKKMGRRVKQYDKNGNFIKEWKNGLEASKAFGKHDASDIYKVCNQKRKTAYGYKWKY